VLVLTRLEKATELEQAWPSIAAAPGISWRTPLQCPDLVDEALLDGAVPFPSAEGLRVPQLLMQHKDRILGEFQAFQRQPGWDSSRYFRANQDKDLVLGKRERQWTEMLLFDRGIWHAAHCDLLPVTCGALRGLLEVEGIAHGKRSGQVSLLRLEEGATLVPHFGSVNWRYTAHLGLLVPKGVSIQAGLEVRPYAAGEVLLLDDSFIHGVEHRGAGPRITLFVNFLHPRVEKVTYEQWLAEKE